MQVRFDPMATFVEVVVVLASVVASSPRRRQVLEHRVESRLVLALALRLELALHFPTQLWAVVQASLEPLLCLALFAVGFLRLFRHGIRQAPRCARLNLHQRAVCKQDNRTEQDRCGKKGARLQFAYARGQQLLDDSCRRDMLQLPSLGQP